VLVIALVVVGLAGTATGALFAEFAPSDSSDSAGSNWVWEPFADADASKLLSNDNDALPIAAGQSIVLRFPDDYVATNEAGDDINLYFTGANAFVWVYTTAGASSERMLGGGWPLGPGSVDLSSHSVPSDYKVKYIKIKANNGTLDLDAVEALHTEPPVPDVLPVEIDIKPGSYPNSINLGSNGVVPVAILSSTDFDATTVDPETVALAGAGVAIRGKGALASQKDVNGDGLIDLELKVETENLDPGTFQDGSAILAGATYAGQQIEGSDSIIIVPPE